MAPGLSRALMCGCKKPLRCGRISPCPGQVLLWALAVPWQPVPWEPGVTTLASDPGLDATGCGFSLQPGSLARHNQR
ncbi:hypothetical protein HaLaN_14280 [Haematococcus lacustris]|uniref:Uncharacterized protein n=1 Tax=Haematococcus lacustris TaxID=44745 RepID=A0A699Z667_HAELA|nr:hypothetical protein HaLaN_14280 [Haematococcus lacustris]